MKILCESLKLPVKVVFLIFFPLSFHKYLNTLTEYYKGEWRAKQGLKSSVRKVY